MESYKEVIKNTSDFLKQQLLCQFGEQIDWGVNIDKYIQLLLSQVGQELAGNLYQHMTDKLVKHYYEQGYRIHKHPEINFTTLFGKVTVRSPMLRNAAEKKYAKPFAELFGITPNSCTEGVARALTDFGIEKSFRRAADQFKEHYHFDISQSIVLRRTEESAVLAEKYLRERLSNASGFGVDVNTKELVAQLDGCEIRTGIMTTAQELGRDDLPPDKKVREENWREVRTGFVRPISKVDRTYVCALASYPAICHQLYQVACLRGLNSATQVIAPSDGGNGLMEEMSVQFKKLQYILDHRHLQSHFYETAEELKIEKALQKAWVAKYFDQLWLGKVDDVLLQLTEIYKQTGNDRLRRLISYLTRFKDCVNYGKYKAKGWPIGSGEVESAHRYIPQERLKIAGACWHPDTVTPMVSLRVVRANGWWEDFWRWRAEADIIDKAA